MAGLITTAGEASYTATKHAVVAISKTLRVEAKRHGVQVSVLCPGVIRTPILTCGQYGRTTTTGVSDEEHPQILGADPANGTRKVRRVRPSCGVTWRRDQCGIAVPRTVELGFLPARADFFVCVRGESADRSADSDFLRPGSPGRTSGVSMATISARVRHYHVEHAVITPTNHPMLRVHRK